MNPKPFIKWVGGKTKLLPTLTAHQPNINNTYIEPFLGGGATLLNTLTNHNPKTVIAADLNPQLITTYKTVRDNLPNLIKQLNTLQTEYTTLNTPHKQQQYYLTQRETYNNTLHTNNPTETAALFIFLNKTSFNGLYRVNKKGHLNVGWNKNPNPHIYEKENLQKIQKLTQNTDFQTANYKETIKQATPDTCIYADPPYRPLTNTSSFTKYTNSDFNDTTQTELANLLKQLHKTGTKILTSNSDPKNADPNDNFFDNLYSWATIIRTQTARTVNSDPTKRGKINELIIKNY